jgi:hypothetical protein
VTNEFGQIREFYAEAFRWYAPNRPVPPIHISFYPYVSINHTIRLRDEEIFVRIGTICSDMPPASHKGLAYILVGKLLRKKIPPGAREVYDAYTRQAAIRDRALASKRARGRKVVTTAKGSVYDLDQIFDSVNRIYFGDTIPRPVLTWSSRKTYRILGHHDAAHEHVAISRSLDSVDVPRYVVEYVVFHEMLHIAHPTQHINGRRYNHTAAFKRDERKFAYFEQAENWIERNVRRLKKEAKRK